MRAAELYAWQAAHPDLCPLCKRLVAPRDRKRSATPQAKLYHPACWEKVTQVVA